MNKKLFNQVLERLDHRTPNLYNLFEYLRTKKFKLFTESGVYHVYYENGGQTFASDNLETALSKLIISD